ncbi:GntR family transcriptional regulator [Clostridium fermenticellae]|uniref:GntR family transcriptional regulator n=1 Tax=Clostridium fermenticellae TaxID=2068654 RepID=A0A386H2P0_9CLOT|nr:GntR family transcriptional regulator [Clostridium fermenticellae]AYD39977.1 GntR family transcriptional regulator [Clostridium fermenticellae]
MNILISNSADKPIYQQIKEQMKSLIIRGDIEQGEHLPSIRNLARELQISVITTKRAYEELEREGFIETVPGKGSFVSQQNKELLKERKIKIIEEKLQDVVDQSIAMDISLDEIIEILRVLYNS